MRRDMRRDVRRDVRIQREPQLGEMGPAPWADPITRRRGVAVAQVKQLGAQLNSVVGDALICAGTISYLGPFTADYRNALVTEWLAEFAREKLPVTKDCSLSKILADPVVVRQWKIDGAPS